MSPSQVTAAHNNLRCLKLHWRAERDCFSAPESTEDQREAAWVRGRVLVNKMIAQEDELRGEL